MVFFILRYAKLMSRKFQSKSLEMSHVDDTPAVPLIACCTRKTMAPMTESPFPHSL
jgi:hypothetical protein